MKSGRPRRELAPSDGQRVRIPSSPPGSPIRTPDPFLPEAMKRAGVEMPAVVYLCQEVEDTTY